MHEHVTLKVVLDVLLVLVKDDCFYILAML